MVSNFNFVKSFIFWFFIGDNTKNQTFNDFEFNIFLEIKPPQGKKDTLSYKYGIFFFLKI